MSSGGSVTVRHSKTRQPSCELVVAGEGETRQAVEGSWQAFERWGIVPAWERRRVISKVLGLLQERFPLLAEALHADAAVSDILVAADQRSATNLTDGAADTAINLDGWIPPTTDGALALVTRQPYGPVLSIPAFNYPLTLALRSIVYPLACGNTVILKSSILIPQLHNALARLFADAGLPDGALQIINFSEEDVAQRVEQLIADPLVRMVNFTGSTDLGRKLAAKCGEHLKPSVMELGGKSPATVLPSADLKLAANNILFGGIFNSGQVCMSTERILVHESVASDFEKELVIAAKELEGRDGFELVRPNAVEEIEAHIDEAIQAGAKLVYPSHPSPTSPASVHSTSCRPVILSNIPSHVFLATTESFAPVLSLQTFSNPSQALSLANGISTGLSSSIFGSLDEALPLAQRIEAGAVHINGMTIHDQHGLPFGGIKDSGWGRFNGRGAVEAFTWTRNVVWNGNGHLLPLQAL
ncbi:hypothetical protein JCM24511_06378 [Saitozyma sp. JCM 24511]|nr:hypothetical protein JCM24511_06378 [Saitozyma sp. JCM 24511]